VGFGGGVGVSAELPSRSNVAMLPSRRAAWTLVVIVTVGFCCVLAGRPGCGFDSTWGLVWAGDVLHAARAVHPSGVFVPTPHPASVGLGMLARILSWRDHTPLLWAAGVEASLVGLLAGIVRLGRQLGGNLLVGCLACVGVATLPVTAVAVDSGTIDVFFAACCVWAVCLAAAHPRAALTVAAVGTLARPEGLLLGIVVAASRWGSLSRRARAFTVVAAVVVVCSWVGVGVLLFGDPLAAAHVTANNASVLRDNPTLAGYLRQAAGAADVLIAVFAAATLVAIARPLLRATSRLAVTSIVVLLLGVTASVIGGAPFTPRYMLAEIAIAAPLAVATLWRAYDGASRTAAARIVGAGVVAVVCAVDFSPLLHARAIVSNQQRAAAAIAPLIRLANRQCTVLNTPGGPLLPVIALTYAHRLTVNAAPDHSACALIPASSVVGQANGFGPDPSGQPSMAVTGRPVDAAGGWVLYAP